MVEKLVPKLRFNEFHDGWDTIFLNSILSFKNGFNASKDQYGFGTKFINVSDILENNYLTYDNIQDYVNVNENELSNYIIEYGDIVFQRSSENREEVGTANVYLGSQPCVYGGFVIRGKKEGDYNPFFLKELLQSTRVRKEITSWSGGSTRYNIGQDSLNKISIILPSIEEQNKISDLLLKVYEKIGLLEYKYQCYKNFKKYLMQQIFTQKLRFAKFTDDWKNCKFKDLGTVKSGVGFSTKYQGHLDLEYNLYKVSDMNLKGNEKIMVKSNNTIDDFILNEMNAKLITEPSIIFAKVGEAIFLNRKRIANKPFLIDNNMMAFTPNDKVNIDFMYYLSTTINFGKYAQTGALPSYNASDINTIKCNIPSKEEQEKIANILSLSDEKIDFYNDQLEKTKEFKKGLLQQMFI